MQEAALVASQAQHEPATARYSPDLLKVHSLARSDAHFAIRNVSCVSDTAYGQQTMKAWQPVLTARAVSLWFLVIGAVFLVVGATIKGASRHAVEYKVS